MVSGDIRFAVKSPYEFFTVIYVVTLWRRQKVIETVLRDIDASMNGPYKRH